MDFPLSNFSNSGIDEVGILVRNHPRSILKHLGSTNVWNTNTKLGYEAIMYNERHAYTPVYNHDINNMLANDWIFLSAKPDIFVVAPVHIIFPIDFRNVIAVHEKNKAGITMVYSHITNGKTNFIGGDVLRINSEGLVTSIETNKGLEDEIDVSLDTYIINQEKLQELLRMAQKASAFFGLRDIIGYLCPKGERIHTYLFQGYVRCFDSLKAYRDHSLELLSYDVRRQLFLDNWPIYTVTHDTPPANYSSSAAVSNSFVANGAQVLGTIKNSIISRNVVIQPGAVVENSIIFTDSVIGQDVHLKHAVVDKYCRLRQQKRVEGKLDDPLYIKQGDII
jgi:glucose-1-phosphate adenylyltransferase